MVDGRVVTWFNSVLVAVLVRWCSAASNFNLIVETTSVVTNHMRGVVEGVASASAEALPRWYRSVTMRSAFRRARRRRTRTHRASSPASDQPHPGSSASGARAALCMGEGAA